MREMLEGIKERCIANDHALPLICTADNCCQVEEPIVGTFPGIDLSLDTFHFTRR